MTEQEAPPISPDAEIALGLKDVGEKIADAVAARPVSGHDLKAECRLIAVSKTQPGERIRAALQAGHRVFGENRIQEASSKWPSLRQDFDGIELHLIGSLQTNKVKQALALFDVIQSLDRPKLARALAREIATGEDSTDPPRLLIQVNTGQESQKGGVSPAELDSLLALSRDELGLNVVGLMCIPPQGDDPVFHFALMSRLANKYDLGEISMGMSADYELAARMGATHVRVGTAIFGARPTPVAAQSEISSAEPA